MENMGIGFHYSDKLGRPVLIYKVADCKFKELLKKYSVEQLINFHISLGHRCMNILFPLASENQNRRINDILVIVDYKDADIYQFLSGKPKEFINGLAEIGNYYPCVLGKVFIVNVPALFNILWTVMKLFMHPETLKKVEISGGPNRKKLLEVVAADDLLTEFGGTSNKNYKDNLGIWKKEIDMSYKNKTPYLFDHSSFANYFLSKAEKKDLDKTNATSSKICASLQDLDSINENPQIMKVKVVKMVVSMNL